MSWPIWFYNTSLEFLFKDSHFKMNLRVFLPIQNIKHALILIKIIISELVILSLTFLSNNNKPFIKI